MRNFHPLLLSVINFTPEALAFFVKAARPGGLGEKRGFLRIQTVPDVIVVFEVRGEFPLSLKEDFWRSRFQDPYVPLVLGIRGLNDVKQQFPIYGPGPTCGPWIAY
ncbi:hypothetical protein AVEN_44437-1 [Araneus ventricosus]|uniref:Uncharacterized protein n=1 Tax=Araneus ventricosus TaxID=182803 RepID=A0A4Y2QG69_ARAVE|nr:hypothetical protein AVEN_44437-1 [Araneus ventricosus]